LTAVSDDDGALCLSALRTDGFHLLNDVQSFDDLSEDNVLSVEPWGLDGADEELRSVGVGTSVGHGESSGLGMLQLEVLIGELGSVDRLTTSSVALGEVSSLAHKLGDDSVERASLEVKWLSRGSSALLTFKKIFFVRRDKYLQYTMGA